MRIHFELTNPDGSLLATGGEATRTIDLSSWDNHSSVVRQLHTRGATARLGQRLTMWVEADRPAPIFPDDTLRRAGEAFHQAVGPYLNAVGSPGSTCSRGDDLVDAPVTEVVEALLFGGWTPPPEDDGEASETGEAEEPDSANDTGRAIPGPSRRADPVLGQGLRRDDRT